MAKIYLNHDGKWRQSKWRQSKCWTRSGNTRGEREAEREGESATTVAPAHDATGRWTQCSDEIISMKYSRMTADADTCPVRIANFELHLHHGIVLIHYVSLRDTVYNCFLFSIN